jgi:hypothetical protein
LGLAPFREASIRLILGADSAAIKENRVRFLNIDINLLILSIVKLDNI